MASAPVPAKVYTVNGAASNTSSSLPDWLTRKKIASAKGGSKRRAVKEQIEGSLSLVQHFEFPEASIRIKTTRDGKHAMATGVYKPQIRVWELGELALKFERHSDSENVDFQILSDDWTKSILLQNDRTVELHTQGGLHYKTRIPRFGRAIAYHFPSCDALMVGAGHEVFRLNLAEGRFKTALELGGTGGTTTLKGINAVDINPAHQLFAFGIDGESIVEFWDPRSRNRVGLLSVPLGAWARSSSAVDQSFDITSSTSTIGVTALSSRPDGLSIAVGTTTGYTHLYDLRAARPYASKDQGYGLPIRCLSWIDGSSEGGSSKLAGEGNLVLSADAKVVKIWERHSPQGNFASVTPSTDVNWVHHLPGTGMLMLANEGIQMTTYYIPQLGPAPRWCSFLDNITEEMEDQTARSIYEDYKFVTREELGSLAISHLVGTPALKPYMHGYFLSLKLYDAARIIAQPFAYEEHREKQIRDKLDKLSDTRIRVPKKGSILAVQQVKVNRALAEKIVRTEQKAKEKEQRKKRKRDEGEGEGEEGESDGEMKSEGGVLNDPRFKALFENPEFEVDEESREFAMLNPAQARAQETGGKRARTAVENEEDESDVVSSDGLSHSASEEEDDSDGSDDSSDAGDLGQPKRTGREPLTKAELAAVQSTSTFKTKQRPSGQAFDRAPNSFRSGAPKMVAMSVDQQPRDRRVNKNASFGERQKSNRRQEFTQAKGKGKKRDFDTKMSAEGGMETSWIPSESKASNSKARGNSRGDLDDDGGKRKAKRKGAEQFGMGMERGGPEEHLGSESERQGRTHRRTGVRSGSRNVFRRM